MPFRPAANPDLAGQFMYQGISSAGEAFARGVGEAVDVWTNKAKERKAYQGVADAMLKNGELSELDAAKIRNMDTDSLKGFIQGKQLAQTLRTSRLGNELTAQQIAGLKQAAQNAGRQPAFLARMDEFMTGGPPQSYDEAVVNPMGTEPLPPLRAAARAAGETGYQVPAGQLDDILRAIESGRTYGTPGTTSAVPGRPDLTFVWETGKSGVPMPVKTNVGTGAASVRPSSLPNVAIFTDESGKSRPVTVNPDAGLGNVGKLQLDNARVQVAQLDADIAYTLGQIQQKGSTARENRPESTGFLGMGKKQWTLQEKLEDLQNRKTRAVTQLQSLHNSLGFAPEAAVAPSAAAPGQPTAAVRWRWDETTGNLVPAQ